MWNLLKSMLSQTTNETIYQPNDNTTPDLKLYVPWPSSPTPLQISVRGLQGPTSTLGTAASDAALTYITLAKIIEYCAPKIKPRKWAATRSLTVDPRAGQMLNAYYDRKGLSFFYDKNPKTKQMVYLCESSDVVAHECGHALLDAMRPDFWDVQAIEIWSFHEAFADITGLVATTQFDSVIDKALKETGGDLRKSNVISMLAEEIGSVLGLGDGLRNAYNTFKYVPIESLPSNSPYDKLSAECHSFGRVFLGAWYELMVNIYEYHKTKMPPKNAFIKARDDTYMMVLQAIPQSPRTAKYHEAIAKIMVSQASPEYHEIVRKTFTERQLIGKQVKALSTIKLEDFEEKGLMMSNNNSRLVVVPKHKSIKLSQYVPSEQVYSLAVGGYNLSNVEVEIAADEYYEFDLAGNLVDQFTPTESDVVEATRQAVMSITSIGPHEDTMWEIKNDKLVRTHFE